jgi:hypothetical protein
MSHAPSTPARSHTPRTAALDESAVAIPGCRERLGRLRRVALQARLEAARFLAEIESKGAYWKEDCVLTFELAVRCGYERREARFLVALGRALAASPALAEQVERERILPDAAVEASRVLREPELQREGDDWLAWAECEEIAEFRRRVRRRIEEVRGREPTVPVDLVVAASVREDFHRACAVASEKAGRPLTEGQAFGTVVRHYLATCDPLRIRGRSRRCGPQDDNASRRVPPAVDRAVRRRAKGRCQVPGCGRTRGLQRAHVLPHACGGGREEGNLLLLCWRHHWLLDQGRLRFVGTTDLPAFLDSKGRWIGSRGPPPPPPLAVPV